MKSIFRILPVALVAAAAMLFSVTPAFASIAALPEPASVTLIGVGLVCLVGKKWMDQRRGK